MQRVLDLEAMNKQLEEALLLQPSQGLPKGPIGQQQGVHNSSSTRCTGSQEHVDWQQQQQQQQQQHQDHHQQCRQREQEQAAQPARMQAELRLARDSVGALEAALALVNRGGHAAGAYMQLVCC